jgi:hypothetical protein
MSDVDGISGSLFMEICELLKDKVEINTNKGTCFFVAPFSKLYAKQPCI